MDVECIGKGGFATIFKVKTEDVGNHVPDKVKQLMPKGGFFAAKVVEVDKDIAAAKAKYGNHVEPRRSWFDSDASEFSREHKKWKDADPLSITDEHCILEFLNEEANKNENIVKYWGAFYQEKNTIGNVLQGKAAVIYCLEYLPSGDIKTFQEESRNRKLLLGQLTPISKQIFSVVNFLYSRGIVHVDIKPHNFLVEILEGDKLSLKLTDFGFSLECPVNPGVAGEGSLHYMAPEQFMKEPTYACDVWAAGATIFFIYTGGSIPHGKLRIPIEEKRQEIKNFRVRPSQISGPVSKTHAFNVKDELALYAKVRAEINAIAIAKGGKVPEWPVEGSKEEKLALIEEYRSAELDFTSKDVYQPEWSSLKEAIDDGDVDDPIEETDGWFGGKVHAGGFKTSLKDIEDFLKYVLVIDAQKRPKASEVLKHRFFDVEARRGSKDKHKHPKTHEVQEKADAPGKRKTPPSPEAGTDAGKEAKGHP